MKCEVVGIAWGGRDALVTCYAVTHADSRQHRAHSTQQSTAERSEKRSEKREALLPSLLVLPNLFFESSSSVIPYPGSQIPLLWLPVLGRGRR